MKLDPAIERRLRGVLEASPGLSDAAIAREAGVSRNTVRRMRGDLVAAKLLPPSISRQGADGRIRMVPGRKRPMVDGQPLLTDAERAAALATIKQAAAHGSFHAARWLLERDQTGVAPPPNVSADDDEYAPPPGDRRADLLARLQRRKEEGSPRHRPRGESA